MANSTNPFPINQVNSPITNWAQFTERVRKKGYPLLKRLDDFPDAILVAGCQRSGTTMLSRVITESEEMTNYWFGADDELDAALILSGFIDHQPHGRYCFQTTYLNNAYREYYSHSGNYQIIWVIRNPFSVIYSMLNNWPSSALDRAFESMGVNMLIGPNKWIFKLLGVCNISRVMRACMVYNAKALQLFEMKKAFRPEKVLVVDYDELVNHKETALSEIFKFVGLNYREAYAHKIHSKSLDKKNLLSTLETSQIEKLSLPLYNKARDLCDIQFGK